MPIEPDQPKHNSPTAIKLAELLDSKFRVPGTNIRFGLDPIVGLIPGIGDAATAAASLALVVEAVRLGASAGVVTKMLCNIGVDFVAGLVPGLDVVLDVVLKSNQRNLKLLEEELATQTANKTATAPVSSDHNPGG